jgi:diguanylate cyclase (GGDEF)-like protein
VTITEYLGTLPKPLLIGLGTVWLIGVSAADYFTHSAYLLEFSPFYLVPVSFFSWFIGKRSGIAASISSAAIGFAVRFRHAPGTVAYLDASIFFMLYIIATFMIVQLKRLYDRERDLSRIDPLTNIPNRRALHEAASQAKSMAERNRVPLSICYIDVDNFKAINDRFGHNAGDRVLAMAAATIAGALRPSDVVARMGGDEFAVLLPGAHGDDAAGIMRRVGEQLQHAMRRNKWPVTFSIGIASFASPFASVAEMLAEADKAMYVQKKRGREPLDECDVVT